MYKDYIFKTKESPKKSIGKNTLKIVKILIYSFLFISMLWGCSEMFVSKYNTFQVVDSSGSQVYKSGIFFEILFSGINNGKLHYAHMSNNHIYEYPYLNINSWSEAFIKTQSPFYGFFVYPTAWLLISIMKLFGGPKDGVAIILSIFVMSIFVRTITVAFTWKTQMNQEKMQLLQVKQQEIKNKYGNIKNDPMAKRKQQMEIMELYKKNKVSPLASIGTTFLSFPFLFALYITIRSTRILKEAIIGQISLINKPWTMITNGHYIYLTLLAVYLPIQIVSMFLPTILSLKKQENKTPEQKKAKRKQFLMQGGFSFMFLFVVISVASGVAIYWIFSGFFQILQTLGFHYGRVWYSNKGKRIKTKTKKQKQKIKTKEVTPVIPNDDLDLIKPNNPNLLINNKSNKSNDKKKKKYTL